MLQSLINDLVRRRLWPIPVAAVLVAIVVPLLFMNSSDGGAPAPAAPAAVQSDTLPAEADKLLSTEEREVDRRRHGTDPFDAPASVEPKSDATGAAAAAPAGAAAANQTAASSKASQSKALDQLASKIKERTSGSESAAPKRKAKATKPKRKPAAPKSGSVDPGSIRLASVNVRYGATKDGKLLRTIPERKAFRIGNNVIAVFLRYSPKREGAMFAVAPGVTVSGSVGCTRVGRVCRYVTIPDGGYARLSFRGADGTRVTRRFDVGIKQIAVKREPVLSSAKLEQGNCLLKKLLNLPARALSVPLEQCS